MRIEHIAMWTRDIERQREFYERYFGVQAVHGKYFDPSRNYESYFLSFSDGARLELMQRPEVEPAPDREHPYHVGLVHLAFSVGSEAQVDMLSAELAATGYRFASSPHRTGDGFYESTLFDPDGNRVEITV